MFEEEAEEYAENREVCDLLDAISENLQNYDYGTVAHYNIDPLVEECFKDGAEFGYNKANEWHYVKDGDYPKEKGNYLVAWKRTHYVEEFGEWGFDVDLFNADEGYFEGVGDYVIAWKEIVLPKEIE